MTHYLIELALYILAAYIIGCLLGYFLRNLFPGSQTATQPIMAAATPVTMARAPVMVPPAPLPRPPVMAPVAPRAAPVAVAAPAPKPAPMPVAAPAKMQRPKGIAAARSGKADNLQRISGVGPKNESILHNLGFFHFDQIAAWTKAETDWVDDHLKFNGRIEREEWIRQSSLLAQGKEAEFTKLYGTGGLKNTKGDTLSGTRTRK
jgi:predicted flap endonuclease-1-like 5' DNA nuclease